MMTGGMPNTSLSMLPLMPISWLEAQFITTALAAALGYRLVRNEANVSASAVEASDLVAMIGQFTRLTGAFADAAADGRVDAGERRQILTLIDQNMAALTSLAHRFGGA